MWLVIKKPNISGIRNLLRPQTLVWTFSKREYFNQCAILFQMLASRLCSSAFISGISKRPVRPLCFPSVTFGFPVAAQDLIPLCFTGSSLSTTSDKITHLHHTANTKCSPGTQNNPLPFLSKYLQLHLLSHFSWNKKPPPRWKRITSHSPSHTSYTFWATSALPRAVRLTLNRKPKPPTFPGYFHS